MKFIKRIKKLLANEFSLIEGKADNSEIDEAIQQGATIKGPVAWALIFAIFIASIGLNTDSIAVIIGAMLISPLMGPIIGVGYGLGVFDFELLKKSFFNLGLTALISVLVSAFYFWLTPLSADQSQLLERTMPTIWDVIIAFCGGMVGVIGVTRKQKTTIIPGVAIATALMPPLCTAGYELSQWNKDLFAGALYLFTINCVYIAFATSIVVWLMKLPHKQYVQSSLAVKVKRRLYLIAFVTMLPSIYLTTTLVKDEIFMHNARQFVKKEFSFPKTYIANVQFLPKSKQIEILLIGHPIDQSEIQKINSHLNNTGLYNVSLVIHQADDDQNKFPKLKPNIMHNKFYQSTMHELNRLEMEIIKIQSELDKVEPSLKPLH
ncbi:MAG: DUF389 domain-containing protein [Legionellaceae bacterium]|nr:DUF389 domain-containing protein [Legionellaceae bacterium]